MGKNLYTIFFPFSLLLRYWKKINRTKLWHVSSCSYNLNSRDDKKKFPNVKFLSNKLLCCSMQHSRRQERVIASNKTCSLIPSPEGGRSGIPGWRLRQLGKQGSLRLNSPYFPFLPPFLFSMEFRESRWFEIY